MTLESDVHIAGVGFTPLPSQQSPAKATVASLISAATKALLDAGVTYDDVTQCVKNTNSEISSHTSEAFRSLGEDDVPVDKVEAGSELERAFHHVKKNGGQCVLMLSMEDSAAVALVLVSDRFLLSRSYLKDSSVHMREQDTINPTPEAQSTKKLNELCQMLWALRGWSHKRTMSSENTTLHYKSKSNGNYVLSRTDRNAVPDWKDVEHKQDGKHRLRYNPASETRDISREDFEAVCATGKRQKEAGNQIVELKRRGGDRAALAKL